jgi:hypothetical protein
MVLFEGLESAMVGVSDVWHPDGSKVERAVYDGEKMVQHFMDDGMTDEEAREWISFNVEGAYVGEATPIVYWDYAQEDGNE